MSSAAAAAPLTTRPIRVLVVDDSAVAREVLSATLRRDGFEVETAFGAESAYGRIKSRRPDVVVLDLQMPGQGGLEFLECVMRAMPLPIVVCSSIAQPGAKAAIRALELGAVDVISKPSGGLRAMIDGERRDLSSVVSVAATTHFAGGSSRLASSATPISTPIVPRLTARWTGEAIVIGASTGGTEALRAVLSRLPANAPPVVIAQHMPGAFTGAFARRLNSHSAMEVREAKDGDRLSPGLALVAPGGRHVEVESGPGGLHIKVSNGPAVSGHRPSVDVLFRSAERTLGKRAIGVLLTGIGQDGAHGMLALKEAGAHTIAQSERTCVVFGMPGVAIGIGAASEVTDIEEIPRSIIAALHRRTSAHSSPSIEIHP